MSDQIIGKANVAQRRLASRIAAIVAVAQSASLYAAPAVTNCEATGSGSLAAAVAGASSGDTINMEALSCSTITLAGALDFSISHLTLQGRGMNFLTLKSSDARVIYDRGGDLTLQDMTIISTNPGSNLSSGGCIAEAGDLTLRRVAIRDCHLSNTSTVGITLGGAIYVAGDLTTSDVDVSQSSIDAGFARGGGIAVLGNANLAYTTISSNTVTSSGASPVRTGGGGLFVQGDLVLKNSTVSGNAAASAGARVVGGGLYVGSTAGAVDYAYLQFDTIEANTLGTTYSGTRQYARGGGFYAAKFSGLVSSTVDHNQSAGVGGGVATSASAKLNVTQATIAYNTAAFQGGAFFTDYSHTLRLLNSTIADNFTSTTNQCAGLFFNDGGTLETVSSIIAGNRKYSSPNTPCDVQAGTGKTLTITGSNNLITDTTGLSVPADTQTADPQLLALAENGGPTRTMGMIASSPARLTGFNVFNFDWDQRGAGFPRTIGGKTDIGSFEVRFPGDGDRIFANGFEPIIIN